MYMKVLKHIKNNILVWLFEVQKEYFFLLYVYVTH